MTHIVVVGAGQAGAACVAKLRNLGFDGGITLVGSECSPPYQRPPLSKKYLLGEMEQERLFLRPLKFYDDQDIALRLGTDVIDIDPEMMSVSLGNDTLSYDHLVLTTGSSPNTLPASIGGALPGVFTVRDLKDVDAMKPMFRAGNRVLIVGGGYIGLEAAAVAASKGLKVQLVEMERRILQRVASQETSAYFRGLHQANGVEIIEGTGLACLSGTDCVQSAELTDGRKLEVDFVIVGVGVSPNTKIAEAAGVEVENGIKTDSQGATNVRHIWAAGDCASFPFRGERIRLESVPNAIDQAEVIAENILGASKEYSAKPWFWSDQYDVKLQIAGLNTGFDHVVTRDNGQGSMSVWYFSQSKLLAVDAMNAPRDYMVGKRLIEGGKSPAPERVADMDAEIRGLMQL